MGRVELAQLLFASVEQARLYEGQLCYVSVFRFPQAAFPQSGPPAAANPVRALPPWVSIRSWQAAARGIAHLRGAVVVPVVL
ncbi:MAG TPA: hypothetical protein DEA38_09620, partial [Stenotrophomonas sp.]|nr:hypothetical protein [Stenotrophomonas sp.]